MVAVARFNFTFLLVLAALLCGCSVAEVPTSSAPEPAVKTPVGHSLEADVPEPDAPVVLFLGDSLSAGYGLPEAAAFPSLVQEKIKQAGLDYQVVNAGVSGDTSAGGLRRVDWLLRLPIAVLILELGGNDGLRGVDLSDTRRNLQEIIDRFRKGNPDLKVIIAGMMIPPNLGPRYTEAFQAIYPDLAQENDAVLIPFLLDGVAGNPELNFPDGIHPTAEGHQIVADLVWKYLKPELE